MVRCGVAVLRARPVPAPTPFERGLEAGARAALLRRRRQAVRGRRSAGYGRTWRAAAPTLVGIAPIGYGDGVRRALSNNADVLVGGRRPPLVGTISMDNVTIDLGAGSDVEPGSDAILIGAQAQERILCEELAARIGTINYEITCGISPRVPRSYRRSSDERPGDRRRIDSPRAGGRVARPALGRRRTTPGWSAARSATPYLRREVVDLDLAIAGGRGGRRRGRLPRARRRASPRCRSRVRRLAGRRRRPAGTSTSAACGRASIEADLALRDFTRQRDGLPCHPLRPDRARPDRPARGPRRPRPPPPLASSARQPSSTIRCAFCGRRGSPPSSASRSTRRRRLGPSSRRRARPSRPASASLPRSACSSPGPTRCAGSTCSTGSQVTAAVLPELAALRGVEQNPNHHLDVHGHTLQVLVGLLEVEGDPDRFAVGAADDAGAAGRAARRRVRPPRPRSASRPSSMTSASRRPATRAAATSPSSATTASAPRSFATSPACRSRPAARRLPRRPSPATTCGSASSSTAARSTGGPSTSTCGRPSRTRSTSPC